jgi:hypothetical protein
VHLTHDPTRLIVFVQIFVPTFWDGPNESEAEAEADPNRVLHIAKMT